MNVARTQAQNEIAEVQHIADIAMNPLQTRLITDAAMTMRRDFIRYRFTADSRNRRLIGGINVGHDHTVGVIEGAAKFFAQRFGARIAMWLKHGQHAFATGRFRGFQRRADLGGVMGIVVNKQKTIALILDFEAAARVLELAQRSRNFFKRNSKLGGEGNHTNSILDVVLPGNIQNRFAQLLPAPINAKDRSEIPQLDIGAAIIRLNRKSTRLNSSHVAISYAVFCLKKKK